MIALFVLLASCRDNSLDCSAVMVAQATECKSCGGSECCPRSQPAATWKLHIVHSKSCGQQSEPLPLPQHNLHSVAHAISMTLAELRLLPPKPAGSTDQWSWICCLLCAEAGEGEGGEARLTGLLCMVHQVPLFQTRAKCVLGRLRMQPALCSSVLGVWPGCWHCCSCSGWPWFRRQVTLPLPCTGGWRGERQTGSSG